MAGDGPTDAEIASAIAVIAELRALDPHDPRFLAVQRAAAHLVKHAKATRRTQRRQAAVARDREVARSTERQQAYFAGPITPALAAANDDPAPNEDHAPAATAEPEPRRYHHERNCYVCKTPYRDVHAFYHLLCPACAAHNFAARTDRVPLDGRRAIVTGGRAKIGFEIARALLDAGAHVTITTRFPADARRRFATAPELTADHRARLAVAGLDFRDLRGVLAWLDDELARAAPLDILVNNAAQTVWRPPAYYAALAAGEDAATRRLLGTPSTSETDLIPFPAGLDEEGKPLDLRAVNSWVLGAADVAPVELVEAHVINAIAPFLFASRLRPLMSASAFPDRYIINVSAMEGVFAYAHKQSRHPHTNMAKAALNMFTRTSAADYARERIHMASVDTGWITQENPHPQKRTAEARGFVPPLDIVDGAARVLAPIWAGVRGAPVHGVFLKDYKPAAW